MEVFFLILSGSDSFTDTQDGAWYSNAVLWASQRELMDGYGSGSIRKNGIYHEIMETLRGAGKAVTELSGITPNPTYAKVQEGAALAREKKIGFILAVDAAQLLSSETLKEIADSRNLIQTGQAQVDHKEIFEILRSCL